ncbi:MAG: gamma-glutamyltransferase [Proteobacteria bacterium]|nr:gamma-glutamyltransferase [Pseudomonadota bacterium]
MTEYRAPLDDMRFVLNELAGLDAVAQLPGFEEVSPDLVDAILEQAGKLGAEVLAPLNRSGDIEGCRLENGVVRTPKGFPEAYAQFIEGGWNGVPFDPDYGGQGLPWLVTTAVYEIWHAANMAFALCPTLTQAAVELLSVHGSDDLKAVFMEKLVSGVWAGTMNLTEPQAGSDLSQIRTQAVREGERYLITGQKIFITHGEHDFTENIVHMVLARTPGGADGIKGLSLFVVPKFLVKDDGALGPRNDLRCLSLEHKMGINASPTCVMSFGEGGIDGGGAEAYLVGEENRGIEYMFTMMNNARLAIGLEGVGIAERALQEATAYAAERRKLIDPDKASTEVRPGDPEKFTQVTEEALRLGPPEVRVNVGEADYSEEDTSYIAVVDKDRNCCSFIQSIYYGFGSKVVPGDLGFALQNRGALFAFDDDHLNRLSDDERSQLVEALRADPELAARHRRLQRVLEPLDSWTIPPPC